MCIGGIAALLVLDCHLACITVVYWHHSHALLGRFSTHKLRHALSADSVFDTAMEDQVDHVRAYFGMRKVSLGRVGGEKSLRPLLNDKFVFHMGMLDQVRHPNCN